MTRHKRWILAAGSVSALLFLLWVWPLPVEITGKGLPDSTRITDRHGELLYAVSPQGLKSTARFKDIPKEAIDALIATEDRTFYSHPGVSLRGIARAMLWNVRYGQTLQGGSTITQQLIRALLQPQKRGFLYKIQEAWLALKYDARYSKNEILERYLNVSFFGSRAYGYSAAARTFFDKDISALSTAEHALLIGLLNAPTSLNPFKNPLAAVTRRDRVLGAMFETGKLTRTEYDEALAEPLGLGSGRIEIKAPHFVMWLLERSPEITQQDEVRTTLDMDLQSTVEQIITRQVGKLAEKNVSSAAVVVLDAKNGDILAMVGSADYFDAKHDGAVNVAVSARQPGSALKPFTYALALSQGMTAASTVADTEAQFFTQEGNPYIPRNYDYGYHGLVRLREALANSYNIAAVKLLERVGVPRLLDLLKALGLTTLTESPEHYGLALTLGDSEVKLLELAAAYGVFPRGGRTLVPRALLSESIDDGFLSLDPKISWLISDILSDNEARVPEFGREGPLSFDFPVAAKTGTTRNSRDNWTIGYTPNRIVAVWVGNADNTPMRGTSGVTGAGPIFHEVMLEATQGVERKNFERPQGLTDVVICRLSGKLPTDLCTQRLTEHFIAGTEPKEADDMYQTIRLDRRNGLLASESCPENVVVSDVFTVFPLELRRWARENGWKQPPEEYSPLCPREPGPRNESILSIVRPGPGTSFLLDPLIPDTDENIIFEARATSDLRTIRWSVDGVEVGEGSAPDFRLKWRPVIGRHEIEAETGSVRDSVWIEVQE